jgi:hypothetical protein
VNVADNHFHGYLLLLNGKYSCLQIAAELSFRDGEFGFGQLPFPVSGVIEMPGHFLTVSSSDNLVVPGMDRNNRVGTHVFPDLTMNCLRVVSPVHDVALSSSYFMTLPE